MPTISGAIIETSGGYKAAQGTLTDNKFAFESSATWNDGTETFVHIKANVTDTASAALSLLMDLQVAGVSKWKVTKGGAVTQAGGLAITTGGSHTVDPTTPASIENSTATAGAFRRLIELRRNGANKAFFALNGSDDLALLDKDGTTSVFNFGVSGGGVGYVQPTGAFQPIGISTTASAANAFLDSGNNNNLLRSTSSARYKNILGPMGEGEAWDFLETLDPNWFTSLADADDPEDVFAGFTAEVAAKADDAYVIYNAQGEPDWLFYERVVVPLTVAVRDIKKRMKAQGLWK